MNIMKEAHVIAKRRAAAYAGTYREHLSAGLRSAWSKFKMEQAVQRSVNNHFAALAAIPTENIKGEIFNLENKSWQGHEGRKRLTDLQGELRRRVAA